MTDLIVIKHRFTSLNAYINAERTNKYIASSIKKKETDLVVILVKNWMNEKKISQIEYPVFINFNWITPNEREDPDNICFAKKLIFAYDKLRNRNKNRELL